MEIFPFKADERARFRESGAGAILLAMGRLRNPRRERFAVEVASMVPVDRAYLAAGYRSKPQWARPNGSKLAHTPEVAARIDELREEFKASCALSIEYLQQCLLPAAEANALDYFEDDGPKKISALTREQAAAISAIKFNDEGSVAELKFHSKPEAVNTLLRSLGAIKEAEISNTNILQIDPVREVMDWIAANRRRSLPEPDEIESTS